MAEGGKKPIKGILKSSASFDREGAADEENKKRAMKWDEMNIIATYHPENKDYGHKKIDEPPTPYNKLIEDDEEDEEGQSEGQLDPQCLAARLAAGCDGPKVLEEVEESSEEDETETEEDRVIRKGFEKKRKMHYNEFQAIKLARQLMEQDEENEVEVDNDTSDTASGTQSDGVVTT